MNVRQLRTYRRPLGTGRSERLLVPHLWCSSDRRYSARRAPLDSCCPFIAHFSHRISYHIDYFVMGTPDTVSASAVCETCVCHMSIYRTFVGHLSGVRQTFVGRLSAVCRTFVGRLSDVCRTFGRLSDICRPYVGRLSAVCRPYVGRLSAVCRTFVGHVSARDVTARRLSVHNNTAVYWYKCRSFAAAVCA